MKELKKCTGINKARGFDGCGELLTAVYRVAGLCPKCYVRWTFSTDEGKANKHKQSIKPKIENLSPSLTWRQKFKKEPKPKTFSEQLQTRINKIARLIDKGLNCLARTDVSYDIQAGHLFSRGAEVSMRFNLHNIHRQTASSNYLHEDVLLRRNLVFEYGGEYFNFINSLRKTNPIKFSMAEYREKKEIAEKIIKRLKLADMEYTKDQRINLRNEINNELGIYPTSECFFVKKQ